MTNATPFPTGTILGYPRIGRRRELKKAVEAFWAGNIDSDELEQRASTLRAGIRSRLVQLGLGRDDYSIPENFSFYDHMLDATVMLGAIPHRFERLRDEGGVLDLAGYFTIARGEGDDLPAEMTKWFDSNYHYLVPEIGPETTFRLDARRLLAEVEEAKSAGFRTRPALVGPLTFLLLAKASDVAPQGFRPVDRLDEVVALYAELLAQLGAAGVEWVQLDEPALVSESIDISRDEVSALAQSCYERLSAGEVRPQIFVSAAYGSLGETFSALVASGVEAIGLDLARGDVPSGFTTSQTLVGGVIDGRNVWRGDLDAAFGKLESLRELSPSIAASTSTSLFHVPHDIDDEPELSEQLRGWLAFADQKVGQVAALARGLRDGRDSIIDNLDAASAARDDRAAAAGVRDGAVRERLSSLAPEDFSRSDYAARRSAQGKALNLPALPTTTIGSFPQTDDIRRARSARLRGDLDEVGYELAMKQEIARVIALQEKIGLDVLVHGEPERNDMVQYFAENLDGFAVTKNGWVQSYGSRCTRPSILWGDVSRPAPITTGWSSHAQSLTSKPVKGMLTGPVTILAWSFVRDDQPLRDTANQVALALREEIADLEHSGIGIIQVDEPALRELLPLKAKDHEDYLDWSVGSFRLATSGADDRTQIHTHLCYSEFGVVIDAIDRLDADVTSIEAARSRMEVVADIRASGFERGIGAGVYDIHSPRVPSTSEVADLLQTALDSIPARQVWVNPDCGLKTRGYEETVSSLQNIMAATLMAREALPR